MLPMFRASVNYAIRPICGVRSRRPSQEIRTLGKSRAGRGDEEALDHGVDLVGGQSMREVADADRAAELELRKELSRPSNVSRKPISCGDQQNRQRDAVGNVFAAPLAEAGERRGQDVLRRLAHLVDDAGA